MLSKYVVKKMESSMLVVFRTKYLHIVCYQTHILFLAQLLTDFYELIIGELAFPHKYDQSERRVCSSQLSRKTEFFE